MATTTPNFGWPVPTSTDLVKDGATAIESLGDSIDASLLDLKGGTSGQVLKKNSNTDMDFVWGADSAGMTNPMTTTGDTIYSSSGSTPARLGIGSTGQVLSVSGGVPVWATPAGGGKVLQLVSGVITANTSTTSGSYVDSGLTATITPSSASSKVLVLVHMNDAAIGGASSSTSQFGLYRLVRGATTLSEAETGALNQASASTTYYTMASMGYVDSPASTSALTYKLQYRQSTGTIWISQGSGSATIILMEIGA